MPHLNLPKRITFQGRQIWPPICNNAATTTTAAATTTVSRRTRQKVLRRVQKGRVDTMRAKREEDAKALERLDGLPGREDVSRRQLAVRLKRKWDEKSNGEVDAEKKDGGEEKKGVSK